MIRTTKRFNRAIEKLYAAFHDGSLNPECCRQCAVGNICDNTDTWKHLTTAHGSGKLSYLGYLNETLGRKIYGFKPSELLKIETAFLKACGYAIPFKKSTGPNKLTKDHLFDGLVAAVDALCEIENIPSVMDCGILFDYSKTGQTECVSESKIDEVEVVTA